MNADEQKVQTALAGAVATLRKNHKHVVDVTSDGFVVEHIDSLFNVRLYIDDPEGQVTLHHRHSTRHNLECGAASLTGSLIEQTTIAAIVTAMLKAGTLS